MKKVISALLALVMIIAIPISASAKMATEKIELNQPITYTSAKDDFIRIFSFTPENDGYYQITNTFGTAILNDDIEYTAFYVYDSVGKELLSFGSDYDEDINGTADAYELESGQTYYIEVISFEYKAPATISITEHKQHTYEIDYDYSEPGRVKADGEACYYCSVCGDCYYKTIYAIKAIQLSTKTYTYDGKAKTPTIKITDSKNNTVSTSNYTVSYAGGRKNVGKYAVTIKFKKLYEGSYTVYFQILPKGTSITLLTKGTGKIGVNWNKQKTQTTGYQIQYSKSNTFSSAKIVTIKSNSTNYYVIKNLSKKTGYYVRIRTYKTVAEANYFSSWSASKGKVTG